MSILERVRRKFKLDGARLLLERQSHDQETEEGRRKRFTQAEMAKVLGIGLATLKKAEAGECLDERIARQICQKLRLDIAASGWAPCDAPPEQDPAVYLQLLHQECSSIDVRGLIVGSGKAPRLPIGEVYIPLKAAGGGEREVSLDETLGHRKLVIIGDPGGGKSTYLRWLAWKRSGPGSGQFPVLVRIFALEDYIHGRVHSGGVDLPDAESPDWLPRFLESRSVAEGWGLDAEFFRRKLREPSTLILLDGLDEIPDAGRRAAMARWFERAAGAYRQARFVVTTRPAAYEGKATLDQFETVRIGDLDLPSMEAFLAKWAGFLFSEDAPAARSLTSDLTAALRARPDIRRMARNPLMLTALAVIQWNDRRLPDQRADLYESILKWLSEARDYVERPPGHRVLAILGKLALEMQRREGGRVKQMEKAEAAKWIEGEFRHVPPEDRYGAALHFLEQETLYSGIVVSRGAHLEFWHLTFEEYLAARKCADLDPSALLLESDRWLQQEWREVFLLAPGVLIRTGMTRVDALFTTALERAELPGNLLAVQARAAGLLGAARRDLQAWKYELPDEARYQALLARIRPIFERGKAEQIELADRVAAAEALGQAGDWRFAGDGEERWVPIPAGTFLMGAQGKHERKPGYDPQADEDEGPVRELKLGAFQMGRYPVTVAEYQRFVDDEDRGYLQPASWRHDWSPDEPIPRNWDEQVSFPNRPVVSVNWFEATAYCEWARVRLPREEEWEYAARGSEGRRYPWGNDDPDASRASYEHSLKNACPVGLFPNGATPEGIQDMAGNVWEWTASDYNNDEAKSVRGGSFYYGADYLRAASRVGYHPDVRVIDLGFRCVRE